ncbi:MAG: histidine phosphatase family protein, partial [Candidatus Thorarchaeota archaeon]|nr:histidine phosphatase family protein [Candidatus Thorarchaeota archaeon]
MFEIVQEPDYGGMSRTIVHLVLHGEVLQENPERLTDRGKNQVFELARSRLVAAPAKVYSAPFNPSKESADIMAKELFSKTQQKDCLVELDFGAKKVDETILREHLPQLWKDPNYSPKSGESMRDAQQRFSKCVTQIARVHSESSVAIIAQPIVFALFHQLVIGGEPQISE